MDMKSKIIYEPSFIIENPKMLTTLCILYDEILLFNSRDIDKEIDALEEELEVDIGNNNIKEKLEFIRGPLKILTSEQILNYYDPIKVQQNFPKASNIDVNLTVNEEEGRIILKTEDDINIFTKNLLNDMNTNGMNVSDLTRYLGMYAVAYSYKIPLVSFSNKRKSFDENSYLDFLTNSLAIKSICELGLPYLNTSNPEDIIFAKENLKDELIEFRSGILELTYLLHQATKGMSSISEIEIEANILVNTKIRAAVISLENKIKMNKNKRIRDLVVAGAKILLSGGNLLSLGLGLKDFATNSVDFLGNLSEIRDIDIPEHKIATYLLNTQKIFK